MSNDKSLNIDLENASANLRTYLGFIKLLENLSDNAADYKDFIHPQVEFTELPNLLNKNGQVRHLETSLEGIKKAKMILSEQSYQIVNYTENGEKIAIEKIWTGVTSMNIANFKIGQNLKAYICAVVEFKDGKIFKHRTYDCYEPF